MNSVQPMSFYKDLVENTDALIFEADSEGCFLYLNPSWEKLLGLGLEDILGRSYKDFRTPDAPNIDYDGLMSSLLAGKPYQVETCYRRHDGDKVHIAFHIRAVLNSLGNQIERFQGMGHDISRRVLTEEALEAN